MTESPGRAADRWAQLTYTSFDDGVRAGGWQVKQTSGVLSEEEQDRLRSQVVTNLDPVNKLPSFPTPEDIAALPRRLVYLGDANGSGRYWHTVAAGPDATGRPGNVFVHALLDRASTTADPLLRPIQLWRSPDWLCPYGAESVRDAVLGSGERPQTGQAISTGSIIDFLLDPHEWRVGALAALLDAVSAALRGGPRIVLGAESSDAGAAWIGAVSHLTSPAIARRISYTTFERASGLEAAWTRGVLIASVPTADLADVNLEPESGHTVVVIDSAEAVTLGALGQGAHVTQAGSEIRVTPWSVLAEAALIDETTATDVLLELELVSASVTTTAASPEWPLAAAMSSLSGHFTDVASVLRSALLSGPPRDLSRFTALADRVAGEIRQEIGGSAAKAWVAVGAGNQNATYDMAVDNYVRLALEDRAWLSQVPEAPIPSRSQAADAGLGRHFDRTFADRLQQLDLGPADVAAVADAMRVLDFGVRSGIATPVRPLTWTADVQRFLGDYLVPVLVGTAGPEFVQSLPRPRDRAVSAAIERIVDDALRQRRSSTPESRELPKLPYGVVAWMFEAGIPGFDLTRICGEADPGERAWVRPSAVAYVVSLAKNFGHEPEMPPFVRFLALWFALDAEELTEAHISEDVAQFAALELRAPGVVRLIEDFGPFVPPIAVLSVLRRTPWPDTKALAAAVSERNMQTSRWATSTAQEATALARALTCGCTVGPRDANWAAGLRRDIELSLPGGVTAGAPVVRELRRLLVVALCTQVLASLDAQLGVQNKSKVPEGLYGTAFTRSARDEPRYAMGTTLDGVQTNPVPRSGNAHDQFSSSASSSPRAPAAPSLHPRPAPVPVAAEANVGLIALRVPEPIWREFAEEVRTMTGSALFELIRPTMKAGAFGNDAILAVGIIASPGSPLSEWSGVRVLQDFFDLRSNDSESVVGSLTIELLRSKRSRIDPGWMDGLVDRIGQAQFGVDMWARKQSERSALVKFGRKYLKELQTKSESAPGEKTRGVLRRNH